MVKATPVIMIMFSVVFLASILVAISSYYGESDWTWMGNQVAGFFLLIMVMGIAFYTLMGWLKKR